MAGGFPSILVDRYLVREELGRGATATVYRAHDSSLGREVAVKLLHARDVQDPHAVERFRREGQVLGALDHPGLVRVFDAGVWQGCPYLVFELIQGGRTLRQAFLGKPLRERVALIRDLAQALAYAHSRGVIHRDVKPDNVLVDRDGRARLSDFGLASAIGLSRMTESGTALGTPVAMAPEQVQGHHAAWGPPTDVWALGVILYEALTGELPFWSDTMVQLGALILEGEPRPPRSLAPVPPELEALCLRCLEKAPASRPADAGVVAGELEAWLQRTRDVPAGGAVRRERALAIGLGAGWGLTALLALWGWLRSPAPRVDPAPVAPATGVAPPADPAGGEELEQRLRRARARADRGDFSGALTDVDELLRRAPGHPEALLLRARALTGTGDLAGARSDLQLLLGREPGMLEVHRMLAGLAGAAGDWEAVERHLGRALELDPRDPQLWSMRAAARLNLRRTAEALEDGRRAVELDPRHPGGHYQLGLGLLEEGRPDEAEACFRAILQIDPQHADALRYLGRTLHARGDFPGALAAYEAAAPLLPAGDPRGAALRRWVELARAGKGAGTGR